MERKEHCHYSQRSCQRKPISAFQYCTTHILEDKSSPYHQCSHVSKKSGKRCPHASLIRNDKKESSCPMHQLKLTRARCKAARHNRRQVTAEGLLESLEHYSTTLYNNNGEAKRSRSDMSIARLGGLISSSDSEEDTSKYCHDSLWQPDSDSESIDSEAEDLFKYAGIMTAEEVVRITRDKLIRLQSLYIEQFKWLQCTLKEKRRDYVQERAAECDAAKHSSDASFKLINCPETKKYLALKRYHRKHGVEALMNMKCQERRLRLADGADHVEKSLLKCANKSFKCCNIPVPLSRFCLKHIKNDQRQVLFRPCGFKGKGPACKRMVANLYDSKRCAYHVNINDLKNMTVVPESVSQEQEEIRSVDVTSLEQHQENSAEPTVTAVKMEPKRQNQILMS